MANIKVLHVFKTYFPDTQGGVEEVIRQIVLSTGKKGCSSKVLTVSGEVSDVDVVSYESVEVVRLPLLIDFASSSVPRKGWGVVKGLFEWADIIHYHFPWPVADLMHFLFKKNKKTVVTYHSDIVKQKNMLRVYKPIMMRFLDDVDSIVATSPMYLKGSPVLSKFEEKTTIIPIGIEVEPFVNVKSSLLDEWQKKVGNNFFFFIGVLRYYKGLDVLIKAAAINGLPVVISGDGPEREGLEKLKNKLNAFSVIFTGRISDNDKFALLSLCQAFVLPSYLRSEAFGVCLLEAQRLSKPLITADIGSGMSYVNIDGVTGIHVAPKSSEGLSAAMVKISKDDAFAKNLGANARKRFEEKFTSNKMGTSYVELYHKLMTAKLNN